MTTLPQLSPALEDELRAIAEESGDDVLAEYRAKRKAEKLRKYPKPSEADILDLYEELKAVFSPFHERIRKDRDIRYLKDQMPEKWRRLHQTDRRVHSRIGHNEILRVRAMQTSHMPQVTIPPGGEHQKDRDRADKQARWAKQLWPALERRARKPIRAAVVDHQVGDGLGAMELFLTSAYDGLELEQREGESHREYLKRTESQMQQAGLPFGIRKIDPLALYFEEDDDGVSAVLITEDKRRRKVMQSLRGKVSAEKLAELERPKPGSTGVPTNGGSTEGLSNTVTTQRYYDHCWYAYIVDGVVVEGPIEHGWPRLPVFLQPCIVTGSPNLSERYQGITWGMTEMETALNDLLTQEWDTAITFGRPKVVVETPADGNRIAGDDGLTPAVLKLDEPGVVQLNPGQKIADATAGFKPHDTTHMQQMLQALWQRSGLNPIAQGESPGADPAGFTVNTLQNSAQKLYQISLQNEARTWEEVCDTVRLAIRDTIGDKAWLSAPMADSRAGGTEWLALAPEDIDETPCAVTIPDDTNRLALRQSLMQANKEGYIPRRVVQEEGFGAEDTDAWDDELAIDVAEQQLLSLAFEEAKSRIFAASQARQQPQSGLVGPDGQPISSQPTNGVGVGIMPAQPQPPSVGAPAAQASQFGATRPGAAVMSPMTAQAGQGAGSPAVQQ